MNEQFKREQDPSQESKEEQAWAAHQAAMDEQDQIWREIEAVFASTPDRAEAERIILEKHASRYEEALKKSTAAWETYRNLAEQAIQAQEKDKTI